MIKMIKIICGGFSDLSKNPPIQRKTSRALIKIKTQLTMKLFTPFLDWLLGSPLQPFLQGGLELALSKPLRIIRR